MVPVTNPQGTPERTPGRGGHFACGLAGLGVVVALFLAGFSAIAALAQGTVGLLSSTAIVWLFIAAWLVLWLGLEALLLGWVQRR